MCVRMSACVRVCVCVCACHLLLQLKNAASWLGMLCAKLVNSYVLLTGSVAAFLLHKAASQHTKFESQTLAYRHH